MIISCCSLELCPTDIGMSVLVDGSDSTRLSGISFGEAAHFFCNSGFNSVTPLCSLHRI